MPHAEGGGQIQSVEPASGHLHKRTSTRCTRLRLQDSAICRLPDLFLNHRTGSTVNISCRLLRSTAEPLFLGRAVAGLKGWLLTAAGWVRGTYRQGGHQLLYKAVLILQLKSVLSAASHTSSTKVFLHLLSSSPGRRAIKQGLVITKVPSVVEYASRMTWPLLIAMVAKAVGGGYPAKRVDQAATSEECKLMNRRVLCGVVAVARFIGRRIRGGRRRGTPGGIPQALLPTRCSGILDVNGVSDEHVHHIRYLLMVAKAVGGGYPAKPLTTRSAS